MKLKNMIRMGLCFLLLATVLLSALGCTQEPAAEEESESAAESESIFAVAYKGVTVELGKDAGKILKALGDAKNEQFVAACGEGGGDQWMYDYGSLILYTVKDGDKETVDAVILRDDAAETADGISIGSTEAEMKKAYGDPVEDGVKRRYTEKNYTLEFQVDENKKIVAAEIRIES